MNRQEKEAYFTALADQYKSVVAKVCYMYTSEQMPFSDLYQEVMLNIWQGLDGFRGESKVSTWIYRTAINTCITWHRRNRRYEKQLRLDDLQVDMVFEESSAGEEIKMLYSMIATLSPVEKAIITLWLDENSYDEIGAVLGISRGNVAVKLHRIKSKLAKLAQTNDY